ncbi:MAG TPA: HAD-IIB family hydrolase [Steroidobacteraceae bacterium]|jgi:phosphomannomutase|nr:HAD-IIB family hydrolase [Steroidobacteraceae bacterium]
MKKLVIFDLDGTLAESKAAIDAEMAQLLDNLLGLVKVAVISGGDWQQFETQVLAHLGQDERLSNLSLLPTCGTRFYRYAQHWELLYAEDFTAGEKAKILDALQRAMAGAGDRPQRVWGEIIEDRGSQITYSALGQLAPLPQKKQWDPDSAKRKQMITDLESLLPEFSVHLGGATSIDITQRGIDKGYGVRKLRDLLRIEIYQMIFIGDALFPGGNDFPAKQAGALSIQVRDPHETKRVIETITACLE